MYSSNHIDGNYTKVMLISETEVRVWGELITMVLPAGTTQPAIV